MINRRRLVALLALPLVAVTVTGTASARPVTPNRPLPDGLRPAVQRSVSTCEQDNVCTIVKDTTPGDPSCTGYSSQTTPPPTIRVLVRTGDDTHGTYNIRSISFDEYLQNVLPDEWAGSYDFDAVKAGAVAVRSYAWYWVTHYGGYIGSTRSSSSCFDVTDDSREFQEYLPGTATDRTNKALAQTAQVAARVNSNILQTSYESYINNPDESCGQYANGSVMSQVGTQACFDSDEHRGGSTGNKYNVILGKYYYRGLQLATAQQQRTQHDFTFEQTSTPVTFVNGTWTIDDGYGTVFHYGTTGDVPAITDDGDGFAHMTVWRPSDGTWHLAGPTGSTTQNIAYGTKGDIPVAAHYDGINKPTVIALFRPSTHTWYLYQHSGGGSYGSTGDVPVPGDYDGDGTTDIAVWHPSTGVWYVRGADGSTVQRVAYGTKGDIPAPGDYDGDGKTDIAIYRPSTHQFWVRGQSPVTYGTTGDVPVTGDFSGDGKADLTVYRPSTRTFYVYGHAGAAVGGSGATPIGSAPYRG
ncbi:SpoIID/LytB domain-containing protein [uncultured Jatrophihabitans sp.]|uniref:SpoIID/LytB domain-containing protein n=1 Tax=uncultured Jatrophihabitans sp. TaxID=1610747 RepID=UPI0035CBBF48